MVKTRLGYLHEEVKKIQFSSRLKKEEKADYVNYVEQ